MVFWIIHDFFNFVTLFINIINVDLFQPSDAFFKETSHLICMHSKSNDWLPYEMQHWVVKVVNLFLLWIQIHTGYSINRGRIPLTRRDWYSIDIRIFYHAKNDNYLCFLLLSTLILVWCNHSIDAAQLPLSRRVTIDEFDPFYFCDLLENDVMSEFIRRWKGVWNISNW